MSCPGKWQEGIVANSDWLIFDEDDDPIEVMQAVLENVLAAQKDVDELSYAKTPLSSLLAAHAVYNELLKSGRYDAFESAFLDRSLWLVKGELEKTADDQQRAEGLRLLSGDVWANEVLLGHEDEYYQTRQGLAAAHYLTAGIKYLDTLEGYRSGRAAEVVTLQTAFKEIPPKVSVIVPVYNAAAYLPDLMNCLEEQTLEEIEVIYVDDGSKDESLELLRAASLRRGNITVLHQSNQGQSKARNVGLRFANGEFVYFLDADDLLKTEALLRAYENAVANDLDMLLFDGELFYESEDLRTQFPAFESAYCRSRNYGEIVSGAQMAVEQKRSGDYMQSPCLYLLRRSFLEGSGLHFIEGIQHEDNAFTFCALMAAERVSHLHDSLFCRRIRPGSTMTGEITFKRAYGYYVCYEAMVESCAPVLVQSCESDKGVLWAILSLVLRNAQKSYAGMVEEERGSELALGSDYLGFRFSVVLPARDIMERARRGKVVDGLKANLRKAKAREAELKKQLEANGACKDKRKTTHGFGLFGR